MIWKTKKKKLVEGMRTEPFVVMLEWAVYECQFKYFLIQAYTFYSIFTASWDGGYNIQNRVSNNFTNKYNILCGYENRRKNFPFFISLYYFILLNEILTKRCFGRWFIFLYFFILFSTISPKIEECIKKEI